MSGPVTTTSVELTGTGTIRDGRVVLDRPLELPDGTEVVVSVRAATTAGAPAQPTPAYEPGNRADITDEELHRLAEKFPAPKEWWDATDDPFQP